jgi:hypothetical protein
MGSGPEDFQPAGVWALGSCGQESRSARIGSGTNDCEVVQGFQGDPVPSKNSTHRFRQVSTETVRIIFFCRAP